MNLIDNDKKLEDDLSQTNNPSKNQNKKSQEEVPDTTFLELLNKSLDNIQKTFEKNKKRYEEQIESLTKQLEQEKQEKKQLKETIESLTKQQKQEKEQLEETIKSLTKQLEQLKNKKKNKKKQK